MHKQAGYTLLELLLGIIIAMMIALLGMKLVYHYLHELTAEHKVKQSISRLEEAATLYYHNNLEGGVDPGVRVPLSLQALYQQKILCSGDLYNDVGDDGKGHLTYQLYHYAVTYTPAQRLITVSLDTKNRHSLLSAKPDAYRSDGTTYHYTWFIHPNQALYSNQQAVRLDRFERLLKKGEA